MKQTLASLPRRIRKIFFRADSGYFNGALFDLLENKGHSYLVKVKLKNLNRLMLAQDMMENKNGKALHDLYKKRAETNSMPHKP